MRSRQNASNGGDLRFTTPWVWRREQHGWFDAERPDEIERTWSAPKVALREHTRGKQRLSDRGGFVVIEFPQRTMFVFDAESLVCRTIANHRSLA